MATMIRLASGDTFFCSKTLAYARSRGVRRFSSRDLAGDGAETMDTGPENEDTIYDNAAVAAGLAEDSGDDEGDGDGEGEYDYYEDGDQFGAPDWDLLDANLSDLMQSVAEMRRTAAQITAAMARCDDMPEGMAKAIRRAALLKSFRRVELFGRRLYREARRRTLAGEV